VRVVSLVPSVTETLLAWSVKPIGVTRFCEQGTRFPTFGGTKDPQLDAIVAASPDLVVMCDQENRKEDAEALIAAGLRVHAIHITHVKHVGPEMVRLAAAVGVDESFGETCGIQSLGSQDWQSSMLDEVDASIEQQILRVFVPIWRKPWMTINDDTYGGSVLRTSGFSNIFRAHINRYPEVDAETILASKPQAVLAPSEPYPFTERQRTELETFAPVQFVDGKDLFWWGARTPAAVLRVRMLRSNSDQGG
jgi:ABC-type Fe3+-hydroxamate transport system substrate-binding protein